MKQLLSLLAAIAVLGSASGAGLPKTLKLENAGAFQ